MTNVIKCAIQPRLYGTMFNTNNESDTADREREPKDLGEWKRFVPRTGISRLFFTTRSRHVGDYIYCSYPLAPGDIDSQFAVYILFSIQSNCNIHQTHCHTITDIYCILMHDINCCFSCYFSAAVVALSTGDVWHLKKGEDEGWKVVVNFSYCCLIKINILRSDFCY